MKKLAKILSLLIAGGMMFPLGAHAASQTTYVNLTNLTYSENQGNYTELTEYETLDEFLSVYNAGSLPNVYVTDFLFDGVSAVKTPDLDDFVENASNDTEIETLEIKVLNINQTGNVELTGEITGAMIGVDTNGKSGDINIILNNVDLDTDSKKAPAVFVYNQDKNYTDAKVTIKIAKDSKNSLEGGKLKKVSLIGSDKLSDYSQYYSGTAATNYSTYSSYYGIYTSEQIKNIRFATVQADSEDLQDGDPYYFYKASGAISSDTDLYFEGEGYLKVTSKNKEGIETKGNLTLDGGAGDYEVFAEDDCLNTTTATTTGATVRNALTINVHSLLASVSTEADEGDAIDSNGTLTINGGTIYAFAHPSSPDAGLDSVGGTYINGGTVIATGNMADQISNESQQKFIFPSFSKQISADTLVVIKDQDDKVITAFKTGRNIQNLLYSSADLDYESYTVYTGGTIEGEETNGLYTTITSYTGGTETSYSNVSGEGGFGGANRTTGQSSQANNASNMLLIMLAVEFGVLVAGSILVAVLAKKKKAETPPAQNPEQQDGQNFPE